MPFFDPPPGPPELPPDPFADIRPGPWIAGVVPLELILAANDKAAVWLTQIAVYPDCFRIVLNTALHRSVPPGRLGAIEPDLRFGVAWPDGRKAAVGVGLHLPQTNDEDASHGLQGGAGGGSNYEYHYAYTAWPLPTAGEVQFVVEWPEHGIPETVTSLDAAVLAEAASRARPIWPEDAGKPSFLRPDVLMRAWKERAN